MGVHQDLAVAALQALQMPIDFMPLAELPEPVVPGALPAMARALVPSQVLGLPIDVAMVWGIGAFGANDVCSTMYDPTSGWYNVLFGAYGIHSLATDGSAWGYHADGTPNFDQLLQIFAVDFDKLTAGQFGCPPQQMCFKVDSLIAGTKPVPGTSIVWDSADVAATVPSLLHDFRTTLKNPQSYLVYGVPDPAFLAGRKAFEPVAMRGLLYMRRMQPQVTLAWGTLCPATQDGDAVLKSIISALGDAYLTVGAA
jgi:hypothetical protein